METSTIRTPRSKAQWQEAIRSTDSAVSSMAIEAARFRIAGNALAGTVGWVEQCMGELACEALELRDAALLERVVRTGISLSRIWKIGNQSSTFLGIASSRNDLDCVRVLLAAGARPNGLDASEQTPILWAAARGHLEVVRCLMQSGAHTEYRSLKGMNFLHAASIGGNAEILTIALGCGFDLEERSSAGTTALHYAVSNERESCVRMLLEAGASAVAQGSGGVTMLHNCRDTALPILDLLLSKNPPLDIQNEEGQTPLHMAALHGHVECGIRLLKAGANPAIADRMGRYPLHEICSHLIYKLGERPNPNFRIDPLARAILESGVNPNHRDKNGQTALGLAHMSVNVPRTLIDLLKSFGAVT
jgi:ankyrin repeat protein